MRYLAEKNRSKNSVNIDTNISIDLSSSIKHIRRTNDSAEVDIDDVWKDEIDSSEKYRLIFTIDSLCSNVLFNSLSEIVYNEEKDGMKLLVDDPEKTSVKAKFAKNTTPLTRMQAIRDTEYTNPRVFENSGSLSYHCGVDMLNNHILRQEGFITVADGDRSKLTGEIYTVTTDERNKITLVPAGTVEPFNTIRDFEFSQMDPDSPKKMSLAPSGLCYDGKAEINKHLYETDSIRTFDDTVDVMIKEKSGWFGFYNKTTAPAPISYKIDGEEETLFVNKVFNSDNSSPGDFIDFFPDRTRFSFTPHYNQTLNRYEKNWNCFLTYPYKNDEKHEVVYDESTGINALVCVKVSEYTTDSGRNRVMFASKNCRHNLTANSKVRFYIDGKEYDEDVKGLGDFDGNNEGYFFSVDGDNLSDLSMENVRFSRLVFGKPCKYYFRIFKRLPNFKELGDADDAFIYENEYSDSSHDFENETSKLAFSKTAYGDDITQIVYTDDIVTKNLKDNLGRPLTDIYLTIVKNNDGNDKWYGLSASTTSNSEVTWSSCFGDVVCGLNIPASQYLAYDYNVRRIHGVNFKDLETEFPDTGDYNIDVLGYNTNVGDENCVVRDDEGTPFYSLFNDELEKTITSGSSVFYGDLVEFSPLQVEETVLEDVYHRFNTLQRELISSGFTDIKYDEMYSDDFNGGIKVEDGAFVPVLTSSFACAEEVYNSYTQENEGAGGEVTFTSMKYPGNIFIEGYFYKPHYKLHIRDFEEDITQSSDTQVFADNIVVNNEGMTFTTEAPVYHNTEMVILEDASPYENVLFGKVSSCKENSEGNYTISVSVTGLSSDKNYLVFKKTIDIPDYAVRYPDDSGRYVWRNLKKFSELTTESELYNMPFANGAHYIYKNIVFFLRRQDPDGEYGLNITREMVSDSNTALKNNRICNITREGKYNPFMTDVLDYVKQNIFDLC